MELFLEVIGRSLKHSQTLSASALSHQYQWSYRAVTWAVLSHR
ncbi:MAG: hypothetical protein V7K50_20465 [Nostoc sp.]